MKHAVVALLLLTACSVQQTSETKEEDSVAVLSEDTIQMVSDEVSPEDTVYNTVTIENRITSPQFDPKLAYVYDVSGLDVFKGTGEDAEKIGHIEYKDEVRLLQDLPVNGYVSIEYEGGPGFVMSDELLSLPVPDTKDVVEYFTTTLMLSKDPVERKNPKSLDDTDGMFSYTDYIFEGGFKVSSSSQYESGNTEVMLPGMTMEKAFRFASYFYASFGEVFEEFPTASRDEDVAEQRHVYVGIEDGDILYITVSNGQGCEWDDSLTKEKDAIVMTTGGGC